MKKLFYTFLLTLFCLNTSINTTDFDSLIEEPSVEIYSDFNDTNLETDRKQ